MINNVSISSSISFTTCTNSEKELIANTAITILASNGARQYGAFVNNSNVDITLILGEPGQGQASLNKGIILKPRGGSYEINSNNLYVGKVAAISGSNCKLSFVECI